MLVVLLVIQAITHSRTLNNKKKQREIMQFINFLGFIKIKLLIYFL